MSGNLQVFHGPFEALEDAFAARVAELAPKAGTAPVLIVAPSRALADRLESLLTVEKGLSLAGVHFHSFHSLAAAVVEEGGFPDGALVSDPLFHDAVVDQALDDAPSLGIAKELRPRALSAAVRSSLRDLVDAGIEPAALAEAFGDELLRGDEDERARLVALLALLAAYEKKLGRLGVLMPSALVRRAAALAPESAWLAGFSEVLYYGFYDLTGVQADAFEAVTASRPSRLYFPYRKGHPAFRFGDEFFEVKLAGGAPKDLSRPGGAGTALGAALDGLFDPAAAPVKADPARVRVVSASGARDEAWAAAKEAARLAEEGIPCGEIAVVARQLEPYRAALADAFAAEGLPLDLSAGEPILRHPYAKAALDLLSLRRRDFPARVVEDLAASPYFQTAEPGSVALWRKLITALGVRAGWLQWRGKLEPRSKGPVELSPHRVKEGLPGFLVPAADVAALWEFLTGVRDSLGGPPEAWSKRAGQARALLGAHLEVREASPAEADARRAVEDALAELEAFDRLGAACSWEDFLDAFEEKLSRATRSAATGNGGVRALDAMDARGHRFRATIVLGLKEKLFPRRIQEDPILRDAARAALRHPGGYWIGRKAAGHEEERLLFYLTAASARERLTLIYPRSDENGRAEVPSTYLRELCRAAGLPAPGEDDAWRVPRPPAERLRQLAPGLRTPAEAALLCALEGGEPSPVLEKGGVPAKALAEGFRLAAVLNARGPAGPHDGMVPPPAAALAGWRKAGLSPTALDEFEKCAFKFFASRVLGLGDRDEGTERGELSSAARGQVYHGALERFYRTLPEAAWGGKLDPLAHLDAVLNEIFADNDWRALGLYPLLWEATRREMSAHLRAFAAWDLERLRRDGFRPRLYEAKLKGEPEGGAPGGLPWRGVADRIDGDESGKRFRVADYKTRRSAAWRKGLSRLAADGESHQIPFYATLAAGALGAGWKFAGGELLFVESSDDEERAMTLTPEDWEKAREPFLRTLSAKIEAISRGAFPITPDDGERGHCSWCDFTSLCRKSHGASRARAAIAA